MPLILPYVLYCDHIYALSLDPFNRETLLRRLFFWNALIDDIDGDSLSRNLRYSLFKYPSAYFFSNFIWQYFLAIFIPTELLFSWTRRTFEWAFPCLLRSILVLSVPGNSGMKSVSEYPKNWIFVSIYDQILEVILKFHCLPVWLQGDPRKKKIGPKRATDVERVSYTVNSVKSHAKIKKKMPDK